MPGCWILSLHLLFQLNNNLVKNKIMKKVMLLVLVSTLSLLLSSCYSLFGLISPASNKKDIKQYVGDRQKYAIKNHHTFLNGFLEVITCGIYTPSKTTFYVPINE